MLKKTSSTKLLKSLMSSDFLFVEKSLKGSSSVLKPISKNKSLSVLPPLSLLKSSKQLVHLLKFFKDKHPIYLIFLIDNNQHLNLIKSFLTSKKFPVPYFIGDSLPRKPLPKDSIKICLSFRSSDKDTNLINSLLKNNIFLFFKIISQSEKQNLGSYRIFNNVGDIKKLTFFLSLLDLVLNKE